MVYTQFEENGKYYLKTRDESGNSIGVPQAFETREEVERALEILNSGKAKNKTEQVADKVKEVVKRGRKPKA